MLLGVPSVNPAGEPFLFRDILSSPAAIFIVHAGPSHPSIFPSLSLCSATPSIIFALGERTNRTATCSFVFDELLSPISFLSWRYFLCSIVSDKHVNLSSMYLSSSSLRFCRSLIKKTRKKEKNSRELLEFWQTPAPRRNIRLFGGGSEGQLIPLHLNASRENG